ncbi:MAG: 4-diphosphocytidyl-2C-methyl-D-erythritol kinase, partial [Rhodospirillaceae bacterium]
MKFGSFATEAIADILSDASAGPVILAHSLTLPPEDPNKGGKGRKIPKGTRLTPSLIAGIQGAGIASVICARLEATDIHEDEAAARIAAALAGPGIRAAEPFTGRANLFAEQAGILVLDRDSLNIVNALDEGMTVATLEPYASVLPRRMLATIKVIPFGLPADLVDHVVKLITEQHAEMAVAPFTVKRVGLIQTELPQTASAMLDKTRTITEAR